MPSANSKSPLTNLVAFLVAAIVVGAFTLTGAAIWENLRFARATDQIFSLTNLMRATAAAQPTFAASANEDVWDALIRMGVLSETAPRINAWGKDVKAVTLTNAYLRLEEEIPTHECRRLAHYLIGRKPNDLGLYIIEAMAPSALGWTRVYPDQTGKTRTNTTVDLACGIAPTAKLALVFRFR